MLWQTGPYLAITLRELQSEKYSFYSLGNWGGDIKKKVLN